jgi:hypothetical protein
MYEFFVRWVAVTVHLYMVNQLNAKVRTLIIPEGADGRTGRLDEMIEGGCIKVARLPS